MERIVSEAIEKFSLIEDCRDITVALSGGADSMALLSVLLKLRQQLNINITAAHLNHMIRGEEAERDQKFVEQQCNAMGVTLFCERADIPLIAKQSKVSEELAARKVRYEFLERVSEGLIATAHTASDNLETVIYNISRGTALTGLCGIPAKRGRIIRPLILCTRAQVEKYCHDNLIPFVTDSTNLSDGYTRNRIRHNVIPVLRDINPSVEETVSRMCISLKEDSEFLDGAADDYIEKSIRDDGSLSTGDLIKLNISIQKRVIRKYIEQKIAGINLENIHINEALKTALEGGRTSLPKKCYAVSSHGVFEVEYPDSNKSVSFRVYTEESDNKLFENTKKINNLLLNNYIDCDKIKGKLVIRTRKPGDSMRKAGCGCTKTVNKIFNENKVPVGIRDKIPVISDDIGVVWIYGIGTAQRCTVSQSTERYIKITVEEENKSIF